MVSTQTGHLLQRNYIISLLDTQPHLRWHLNQVAELRYPEAEGLAQGLSSKHLAGHGSNAGVSQKVRRASRTGLPHCYPVHQLEALQSFPAHVTLKQSTRSGESYLDDSIQEAHSDSIIKQ